ncbi:MAG TPA: hypothetical protein VG425_07505 [Casimicrobiaceae bacterium]|jgi:hypothetical protein|nr:hypothetical protein [Casimicrobiaceae bacterium]
MNSFQRKSLYAALAGVGALGVTGTADAVNVNPNSLGQVLIYPYYTVNTDSRGNAFNSLISVVNSTNSAKAVKVRFLEGKDSREVLDFNLFLSAYDVWTGAVIPSPVTAGGRVFTTDQSCTIPSNTLLQAGVDFVNFAYTGSAADGADTGLDRTKEGYVEMIEMSDFFSTTCTYIDITHIAGIPKDCAGISDGQALSDSSSATGGLFGAVQIINVDSGGDYDADAVALQRFNTVDGGNYQFANSVSPQLTDAHPQQSVVYDAERARVHTAHGSDVNVYISDWTGSSNPADTVSAVLMHNQVMNEFILDSVTNSATDWVVTFPTKRFYVLTGTGPAEKLFQRNFNNAAGACDDVTLNIYDREEQTTSTPTTFSPPPPTFTNSICWEANIITFNSGNVFGSQNSANINTGFQHGWLNLGFAPPKAPATYHALVNTTATTHIFSAAGGLTVGETKTYMGLPVVGFAAASYTNGVLTVSGTAVLANYGSKFGQKATTVITN